MFVNRAWLAIGLAALALRLTVPAGFMPALDEGRPALVPCSGSGPILSAPAHPAASAEPGSAHHGGSSPEAAEGCAFADLALPAMAGADPVPLAAAFRFAMAALPFAAALPPTGAAARLRPPPRGPPLPA